MHITCALGGLLGMLHGHLQHQVGRDFKDLWILAVSLQDQRQHIEAAIAWLPAQVDAQLGKREAHEVYSPDHSIYSGFLPRGTHQRLDRYLGELQAGRVPSDGAIGHLVGSVPDELRIPDPEVMLPIAPLGEHSDGRPSPGQGYCRLPTVPGWGGRGRGSQPASSTLPLYSACTPVRLRSPSDNEPSSSCLSLPILQDLQGNHRSRASVPSTPRPPLPLFSHLVAVQLP